MLSQSWAVADIKGGEVVDTWPYVLTHEVTYFAIGIS